MTNEKRATSFKLDERTYELIGELKEELGATSKVEVIRIALKDLRNKLKGESGSQEVELLKEIRDLLKEKLRGA